MVLCLVKEPHTCSPWHVTEMQRQLWCNRFSCWCVIIHCERNWVRSLHSCTRTVPLTWVPLLGEQEAFVLLACVMGRADVLEHRCVIILDSGVQVWPGSHLSHPGNGWVTLYQILELSTSSDPTTNVEKWFWGNGWIMSATLMKILHQLN